MFGSEFFAANRERLRRLFTGTAPIVIAAHGSLQKGGDEAFPFHQDGSFWYLTGIDVPDVILVMDKARDYLIVPERSTTREAFDGAVTNESLAARSGIAEVLDERDGWKQLRARLKKVQHVATLAANPPYIEAYGMYTNPARPELIRKMKAANDSIELLDLRQHLARMRMVKQPIEIAALQQAIDVTIAALKEVTRPAKLAKYAYEYEIEADLSRGFRRRGAQGHAFAPIVASGPRACTMHSIANEAALASDELVLIDVGAGYDHYAADITRTLSLGGRPSHRQSQVFEAVLEAQQFALATLKPGLYPRDFEKVMEQFIGEKLRELGLIKTISHDIVRQYYPHAASHFLGIDVHDAGDYDRPYEPGVVLALELGIYIAKEGVGVRLEDDVVITSDGVQNLSASLPWSL